MVFKFKYKDDASITFGYKNVYSMEGLDYDDSFLTHELED